MNPTVKTISRFGDVELPEWEITPDLLIPYGIGVFGGSGSGKTTFTRYLIRTIQTSKIVETGILFNPTGNADYTQMFPGPFIHHRITKESLNAITRRQEKLSALYKASNDSARLQMLYKKYAQNAETERDIDTIRLTERAALREFDRRRTDSPEFEKSRRAIESNTEAVINTIYKHAIARFYANNKSKLGRLGISDVEAGIMRYILINPYLLIVFDDCAAVLKEFMRTRFMKELYFMMRHLFVVSLMLLQNDTMLEKSLRNNMHLVFFTSVDVLLSYFQHGAGAGKATLKIVEAIAASRFFDHSDGVWRVLIYNRLIDGGKFAYCVSREVSAVQFGGNGYHAYAQRLDAGEDTRLAAILRGE